MSLSTDSLVNLLTALGLLVSIGLGLGYVFRRLRQPPVIGEILAGLILGPTVLGAIDPALQESLISSTGSTATVLGALYQLGLLLLMFCSGSEMRAAFQRRERRTAISITISGTILPLATGLLLVRLIDTRALMGDAGHATAFALVFGIAVAVTSIPVISRILTDLGLIETPFAGVVLSAAVVEDIILYVILSIAIAMVGGTYTGSGGLAALVGLTPDTWPMHVYHVGASLAFFGLVVFGGALLFGSRAATRFNLLQRTSPIANMLVFMFAATILGVYLGVAPMLGAFAAGLAVGRCRTGRFAAVNATAKEAIRSFAFAFFIPIYFTIVGLRLNLRTDFDPTFFLMFLGIACLVKATSVFAGARLAGESSLGSWNLAVAMNARGGPGIVLASLAFDARIVSESFYTSLVMLAIVTSLMAGSWLDLVVRRKWPLLGPMPSKHPEPSTYTSGRLSA